MQNAETTKKFLYREARSTVVRYWCRAANLLMDFAKAYSRFSSAEDIGAKVFKESDWPVAISNMRMNLNMLMHDDLHQEEQWATVSKRIPFLKEILLECQEKCRVEWLPCPKGLPE